MSINANIIKETRHLKVPGKKTIWKSAKCSIWKLKFTSLCIKPKVVGILMKTVNRYEQIRRIQSGKVNEDHPPLSFQC
uniref:Uncharacterized protein n=1 Tax=Heterorhabditis bacteriophora TaxID=37862 RepID=A0A1I7WRP1_HETBA